MTVLKISLIPYLIKIYIVLSKKFIKFEIAFSPYTLCVCVCVYIYTWKSVLTNNFKCLFLKKKKKKFLAEFEAIQKWMCDVVQRPCWYIFRMTNITYSFALPPKKYSHPKLIWLTRFYQSNHTWFPLPHPILNGKGIWEGGLSLSHMLCIQGSQSNDFAGTPGSYEQVLFHSTIL